MNDYDFEDFIREFHGDWERARDNADKLAHAINDYLENVSSGLRDMDVPRETERQIIIEAYGCLEIRRPTVCTSPPPHGHGVAQLIVMNANEPSRDITRITLGNVKLDVKRAIVLATAAAGEVHSNDALARTVAMLPLLVLLIDATDRVRGALDPELRRRVLRSLCIESRPVQGSTSKSRICSTSDIHANVAQQCKKDMVSPPSEEDVRMELVRLEDLDIVCSRGSSYWRLEEKIVLR